MSIKHMQEYRDPEISRGLLESIARISKKKVRLMEVCGTHTVSIFRSGIKSLLPENITLLSGPGCPVCVTAQSEINAFIEIAGIDDVIVTTFGDLMRVPGTDSSLQEEQAKGADIRIVYSALDALEVAKENPGRPTVFLGVGFETTAPTIAAAILTASELNMDNFHVFSAHKLVPPALVGLLNSSEVKIDGFILPGHVSVIIGADAYLPIVEQYQMPCVVAGFEPADIFQAISMLIRQIESGAFELENAYKRAVTDNGNKKALTLMNRIFETVDTAWRGIGVIASSGLKIRPEFARFDARQVFDIKILNSEDPRGCICGEILRGIKTPPECPLYKTACTPTEPVGPCMVSSEGSCAAHYKYSV